MTENKKPKYREADFINQLKEEFKSPFFDSDELMASASVGLYYKLLSYQQENKLGTRTLIKEARYLLSDLDRTKLMKLFDKCIQVAFLVKDKGRYKGLSYSNIRITAEDYLKQGSDTQPGEKLSLAFIIGYDSWLRTIINLSPEEVIEEEEKNE